MTRKPTYAAEQWTRAKENSPASIRRRDQAGDVADRPGSVTWPCVPIGTLCEPTGVEDPQSRSSFRYVDISSIDRLWKRITEAQEIKGPAAPSRARKAIRAGDVLVSTVRPNLNAVAVVPDNLDGEIASTGFAVLRPKRQGLSARYLYYYCWTPGFVTALSAKVRGAQYPAVSDEDVRSVPIPLPALSEQHRIVEILDQADRLRRLRAEADAKAERILSALFMKMFGRQEPNRGIVDRQRLDALVEIGGSLVDPNCPEFIDLPHVGGEHIEKNTGRLLPLHTVGESRLRSSKFFFTERHVLYCKIRPYLNKVAYPQHRGLCSADIYPLLPKDERLGPWYLTALLRSDEFLSFASGQSDRLRMPKLNRDQLGGYLVSVPAPGSLATFEAHAASVVLLDESRCSSEARVTRLVEVLLHRAYSGDLTLSWREAHMNQVVQEMEQQAKALAEAG